MAQKEIVGVIRKVSGPLIVADHMEEANVYDVVRVSEKRLIGEVLEVRGSLASIQVYEETIGIGPGEPVYLTGEPLSVELAPGLLEGIFDGIQRPLTGIYEKDDMYIPVGVDLPRLDRNKKWLFHANKEKEDIVSSGDIIGYVDETDALRHKIMVPHGVSGKILTIENNKEFTIVDVIAIIEDEKGNKHELTMLQRWPVRRPRPFVRKMAPKQPMITGQRVIDSLFPISMGGIAAIPGPFGSGKTVVQHQLAKWSDSEIIVYIGCGERGNEMTDVLMEFPNIIDPHTNKSIMQRTVLIANTSNMPVAAREASIYTGITIAEYFRDMGYKVSIMADSTSRWAEALREMSARLEEMPGEEGYPAYLSSRLSEFYERAGYVVPIGDNGTREGAITAIGAVSPPGGDTSEPVSQATLRIVKVFWGLSSSLAYRRHFPAIDWLRSYSLYDDVIKLHNDSVIAPDWSSQIRKTIGLLQEEQHLLEIVRLVGIDSLQPLDRLKLLAAQMIREDFLHQNAFDEIDTYTSPRKQYLMLKTILNFYAKGLKAIEFNVITVQEIEELAIRERIGRFKYVKEEEIEEYFKTTNQAVENIFELAEGGN